LTLDCALKGHAVVIPGVLNMFLRLVGGWVPPTWIARLV